MARRGDSRHSTQCLLHASRPGISIRSQLLSIFHFTSLISSNAPFAVNLFSQDANNLREALKYSAHLLSELRTSKLSPHKYYELCKFPSPSLIHRYLCAQFLVLYSFPCFLFDALDMRAFDELRRLEMFFKDESRHGVSIVDLYELVQHAGNILPRL